MKLKVGDIIFVNAKDYLRLGYHDVIHTSDDSKGIRKSKYREWVLDSKSIWKSSWYFNQNIVGHILNLLVNEKYAILSTYSLAQDQMLLHIFEQLYAERAFPWQ